MLLPGNKVPAWGAAYSLAEELSGISKDHPPSAFVQNLDDTTAPPQGTLAYAQKLLALGAPKPVIHMCAPLLSRLGTHASRSCWDSGRRYNKGGHGFGLCQTFPSWLEVCDWPKAVERFLQDNGLAKGWPEGKPTPPQMLHQNCE